jgi:hypothetical protein
MRGREESVWDGRLAKIDRHFFLSCARILSTRAAEMATQPPLPVGYVVVIKKDNEDGGSMPVTEAEIIFGR